MTPRQKAAQIVAYEHRSNMNQKREENLYVLLVKRDLLIEKKKEHEEETGEIYLEWRMKTC
jgi:hypothetical protein